MIELKKLTLKYGVSEAVSDVTCKFDEGKTTSVIGPSGSGKTTLVRCIIGLESSYKGEIFLKKEKIHAKNQKIINQKIGIVFQHFNLFPHMTILQNSTYAPVTLGLQTIEEAEKAAVPILKMLGIFDKRDFFPKNLSGGQKQRAAICRALMTKPEVLIFDEPTSALDPESIKDIVSIIEELKTTKTIIIVTHHLHFAQKLSDNIIFMDKGKKLCEQEATEFFKEPNAIRAKMFVEAVMGY
ncbi:MAG: ATP-binding cassette domain-containing protein [Rickettsiaceae bacterium]|nr:ATP-binding cassette domain-containing protein [Rickettsiaceae bacterium]